MADTKKMIVRLLFKIKDQEDDEMDSEPSNLCVLLLFFMFSVLFYFIICCSQYNVIAVLIFMCTP